MGCFGYLTLFLYYVYFLYQMYKVEVEAARVTVTAMILSGPCGIGSDPFGNWLRCPQNDLSTRSRDGHK